MTVAGFPLSDPCANTTRAPWGNVASNPNRARVQALCRRQYGQKDPRLVVGELEIDTTSRTVRRAGRPVTLTPRESEPYQR